MRVFWFEFILALRRLQRRRTQNGLLLVTFAVSVTLSLLSWTLFRTVHLSQPEFDPEGKYWVLAHAGQLSTSLQFTREEMEAYRANQEIFDDVGEMSFYLSIFLKTPGGSERVLSAFPSSRALQIAGARPLLGTLFTAEDDKFGAPQKVLLSERVWRNSYASDPEIVGKPIVLSGEVSTIVGVMPASFRFPNAQDVWLSYGSRGDGDGGRYGARAALVTLKPGITKERAERDLQVIQATFPPDSVSRERGFKPGLMAFRDFYLWSEVRVSSLILFALSLLFLAVSCANAANLMVIDFLGRRPEVATSLALGVPHGAAVRSVCWQVGLIALGALAVALLVLPVAGPWLFERIKVINGPYWMTYQFAWREVGMGRGIAGVAAVATLVTPIAYLLLVDPEKIIRDHANAGRGAGRAVWRRLLLTGQVALLTVLGVSAALLVRSNRNVGETYWGFEAASVFEGRISTLAIEYSDEQQDSGRLATHRKVLAEVRRRPETEVAAFADNPSGYSNGPYCAYATDPGALMSGAPQGEAFFSGVTEKYFEVLKVPFESGEDFPEEMPDKGLPYAILTSTLAQKLWPGESALNRTLYVRFPWMKAGEAPVQLTVRVVVRDFHANGPRARTNDSIFTPYAPEWGAPATVVLYLRDHAGVAAFNSINDAVHRAEPRVALYFASTIKRVIDLMLNSVRMTTELTTVFAAAAVLMCAIGVYSLTVAQVLQSSREFGIRMALGAEPARLWRDFTRGHLWASLIGVALGLVGASQVVRVLRSLLFGVDPHSVAIYAGVAVAILAVAGLACVPSLRRLKKINPADCLRSL